MTARAEILDRIAMALADRPTPPTRIPRDYRGAGAPADGHTLIALTAERISDYGATVHITDEANAANVIAQALVDHGASRVIVPSGFPAGLLSRSKVTTVTDEPPLRATDLDALDGVLTTCAVAVAETGTIVLDASAGQGRRALTLVPDYHLVVVRGEQIVASVPDAIAALDPTRPLTWISGPSATSDIELARVEGVHGPRTLVVVMLAN